MTKLPPSQNTSARTRALPFAQLLCPSWVHDTNTGALLDANPAALRLYGYEHTEFVKMTVDSLRHPQEHRHLNIHLDASAAAAAEGRPTARPPVYWLHQTSSGATLALTLSALDVDWNGRPARMVFVTDVTALRAARLEGKLLQRCIECEGNMIVVTQAEADKDGCHPMLFVNKSFEQHTGYSSAEVLGCDPEMFHGPLTEATEVERMRTAMSRREAVMVELWHYDKLGSPYRVEMTLIPVADERGSLQYWVSSRRDISEREHAAMALSELNDALDAQANERTLQTINHTLARDASRHLNKVRSFADMIQVHYSTAMPADATRLLGLLQESVRQVQQVLRRSPSPTNALGDIWRANIAD
jgi:PAS domain S-box-containing protein